MLVFPSGAKIKDKTGLLQGDYKDGRRIIIFKNMEDVNRSYMRIGVRLPDEYIFIVPFIHHLQSRLQGTRFG